MNIRQCCSGMQAPLLQHAFCCLSQEIAETLIFGPANEYTVVFTLVISYLHLDSSRGDTSVYIYTYTL